MDVLKVYPKDIVDVLIELRQKEITEKINFGDKSESAKEKNVIYASRLSEISSLKQNLKKYECEIKIPDDEVK